MHNRKCIVRLLLGALMCVATRAHAIGWDNDDYLVAGSIGFPVQNIGVFDHDFTFKGTLDTGFFGIAGMDFDASGHLVAVGWGYGEVRVYESTGSRIGGFISEDLRWGSSDLVVAQDGSYIIGQDQLTGGARRFTPQGTFLRQYGNGDLRQVAIVNETELWAAAFLSAPIRRFDLTTGVESPPLTIPGLTRLSAIHYSDTTQTLLLNDSSTDLILEVDSAGNLIRTFQKAEGVNVNEITRGMNGEVFATTTGGDLVHWRSDGALVDIVTLPIFGTQLGHIVWAGSIPEPSNIALMMVLQVLGRHRSRSTSRSQ